MPYTSPTTQVTGTTAPVSWATAVKAATDYLANPPACYLTQSGTISLADASLTLITWNGETVDTDNMHSTVTNTGRITINTAGLYALTFQFRTAGEATSTWVEGRIKLNGATYIATQTADRNGATFDPNGMVHALYKAAVNDYFEAVVYQDNTNNVAINFKGNDANGPASFSAVWVGLG